ncbi:MAG: cell division protein ZapD [Gammaproteobacteria bacterium]|nr:cell division protein ZapD [Gammaproteobacteria bacterium]
MSALAEHATRSQSATSRAFFEQPLNERLRTFLRLEFLYRQLRHHLDLESPWDSRAVLSTMLDIIAILSRGDVRSDVQKELERQATIYDQLRHRPQVDERRLTGILRNLQRHRESLAGLGPQYLFPLRENEFLNAVKHRSAIPGGTCEFDLPDYTHWLRGPHKQRRADMDEWLTGICTLCESVAELMWIMRAGGEASPMVAVNGVFQHSLSRTGPSNMLRVGLADAQNVYPEISASHHRFTVRFMTWSGVASRPVQVTDDVEFDLQIC